MTDQIIDKKTVAIPGPMGDVTPAALAAQAAAEAARDEAETFSATTETLQRAAVETILEEAVPEVRLGTGAVRLREIVGNGGNRILLESTDATDLDVMPYFEVRAAQVTSGVGNDVGGAIGGYQAHYCGDGTTPNNMDRLYFFIELHAPDSTIHDRDDLKRFTGIGISQRNGVTIPPIIFYAGGRPGLTFHGMKANIELMRNTALVLDDRAYGSTSVGTVVAPTYLSFRREGGVNAQLATFRNDTGDTSTVAAVRLARNRGTVAAPAVPQAGDLIGAVSFGTMRPSTVETDQVGGTFVETASVRAIANGNWDADATTARGTKINVWGTNAGEGSQVCFASLETAVSDGCTSLWIRTNRGGSQDLQMVRVGAADSAGAGKRALYVLN